MRAGATLVTLCLCLAACEEAEAEREASEALVAEVIAMQRLMALDPVAAPYAEAEDALAEDLPVRASERLEAGAIPAASRQVDLIGAVPVETSRGRSLQAEIGRVYARRVGAFRRYSAALSRGPVEDLELLDAIGEVRAVEEELLGLHAELAEIRPSLVTVTGEDREPTSGAR